MECEIVIKVPRKLNPSLKRKQGFRFDMYCWIRYFEYNEIVNKGVDELDGDLFIRNIMMFAAESYCKEHGKKKTFNTTTVQYWIDNTYQKDLKPIVDVLMSSKLGGQTIREYIEEYKDSEKKKSHIGK